MPTLATRPIRRPFNRQRSIKIFLAVLGALLVHALLFLAVIWIVPHWPRGRKRVHSHPIELTMLPPTAATLPATGPVDGKPTPPPYIRTTDDQASAIKPDDPAFQSHQDTLAASMLAANGDKPMPTTEGKEVPFFDFEPRPYHPGDKAADAAMAAPSAEATPVAAVSTPPPTPPPVNKKPPLPAKSRPSRKAASQPTPAAGDLATAKAEASPTPDSSLLTPQDLPPLDENSIPPPPKQGQQAQRNTTANSTVTSNGVPKPPGYQPQTMATKMTGNINNRGKSAVSAIGTPMGRYQKAVSDAIGMLWYYKTGQDAAEIGTGTVKIHFYITRDGHIRDVKFTGGNPNGTLGLISEQSISEAQIEPIPDEIATVLDGGSLEYEMSFSMYEY